jgi:TetR/AcrR family transcriptional repressor of mexJK operon
VAARSGPPPGPGREAGPESGRSAQKRAAIAAAALTLFIRDGYERTSVDAIAAEAGVSKRTVYNHYSDKEQLLLSVVRDAYRELTARFRGIMEASLADLGHLSDLESALTGFARDAMSGLLRTPERVRLVRLVITEAPHFPGLIDEIRGRESLTQMMAEPLARLAAAGQLDIDDPVEAAGHLSALTFGQVNNRSLFGSMPLADDEADRIVSAGVRAFLRAYRPASARS